MIRQKVMLTIMSVCLVNINISAAELLPEESTSSVEISFEEEIEETESDLKLEDSVTTEVVLDQYYEESAVETESYEELVNQEIMDSVPPETESMVNNLKSVEEIIGKTDQIKQISKENEQLMNLQEGELILLSQLSQLVDETTTTLEQYKVAYAINQETGDPLDAMIYRYNGTNHTYILNENAEVTDELKADFKNFINALNILFALLIIYNLILAIFVQSSYMYIGYQGSQKVFVGTFESRNGISMVMIPAIAFILIRSEYIYEKVRNKDILLCFMVLIIILLSKSSTGFIVGSLLVIYVLLLKKIKINININKLMSIYTIIYTQVVIFRIQETVFRGFIENTLQKNVTLTGRTLIWDFIMKIIPNSLIFGYGRNDIIAQNAIIRDVTEAHNGLLEILLCTGIIGLFVFILILLNAFKALNKSNSKISYILSMAIFLYFCIALTESAFTYTKIGFWILIIISSNIEKIIKQKDNLGYKI